MMGKGWLAGAWLAMMSAAMALSAAEPPATGDADRFTLTSTDFSAGGKLADSQVFNGFGCKGANVSPALAWSGAPSATKSFALLVHDPDAPTGSGWWHWLVYNIPASVSALPAGAGDPQKKLLPAGAVQGRTDFGSAAYGGPCPPPGSPHHYNFRLYALKVAKLDLPANATAALVSFNVHSQALGEADLTGLYGR
ncbi:MAG TPA: YbhB/YbcL family Raf kinase inhibitor-like protein [Steroidobacteraceae bacterium]|jgi:Raf kinase inhibitor-like YbhB/YbcL family protein